MHCGEQEEPQSAFVGDLTYLIHEYIDEWLFQVLSKLSRPLRFAVFWKLWRETNFEVILSCRPKRLKPEQFLQHLFQTTLMFFEHPSLVKLPKTDEYLKVLEDELHLVIRVACVYTLYLLYFAQNAEETREKIRISVSCFHNLLHWVKLQNPKGGIDGSCDALKSVVLLLQDKAFRVCHLKLPLQLPQSLMEPLPQPVICKYELGAKGEEGGSKKRSRSSHHKSDPVSTDSEVNSWSSRVDEIMTILQLHRLEKSWRRWENLSKLIEKQRPDISHEDNFHEEMLRALERWKGSLVKEAVE